MGIYLPQICRRKTVEQLNHTEESFPAKQQGAIGMGNRNASTASVCSQGSFLSRSFGQGYPDRNPPATVTENLENWRWRCCWLTSVVHKLTLGVFKSHPSSHTANSNKPHLYSQQQAWYDVSNIKSIVKNKQTNKCQVHKQTNIRYIRSSVPTHEHLGTNFQCLDPNVSNTIVTMLRQKPAFQWLRHGGKAITFRLSHLCTFWQT